MKRRILSLGLLFGVVLFLLSFTRNALTCAKLIFEPNEELPVTVYNLTFRVGTADDAAGKEGLAYLTARLLKEGGVHEWDGMPARTREEIEEFLFPMAADLDLSIEKEQTSFRVTATKENSQTVFKVLAQMLLAPAWGKEEFDRIKTEMQDALTQRWPREDQEELGKFALDYWVYGATHPYAHVAEGKKAAIENLSLEDVRKFHKENFVQRRLTAAITGVLSAELSDLAKESFTQLPVGISSQTTIKPAVVPSEAELLIVKGSFESTGVHLAYPLSVNRAHSDFGNLYLMSAAFGKHRSFVGRLMSVVREIRGLNYGTYAYVEDFPHGGELLMEPTQAARAQQAFSVWARPTPLENGCFLLRQVVREVNNLVKDGITEEEYTLSRSHLLGYVPLLATGISRQVGYSIDSNFYGIKGDYLKNLRSQVEVATKDGVHATVKRYINPTRLRMVVVTSNAEEFKNQILSEACKITYGPGVEKPAEVLAEDEMISKFSVGLKAENIKIINAEDLF